MTANSKYTNKVKRSRLSTGKMLSSERIRCEPYSMVWAGWCAPAHTGGNRKKKKKKKNISPWSVFSDELARKLKSRTYRPLPVRRVVRTEPDGWRRPLGIPAIRDGTAEMAAVLILETMFKADLLPEHFAYRRDGSPSDRVRHAHRLINRGHEEIAGADLGEYFHTLLPPRFLSRSPAGPGTALWCMGSRGGWESRSRKPTSAGKSIEARALAPKVERRPKGLRLGRC